MDFSPEQTLAITNTIIELIVLSGNTNFAEKRSRRSSKFEDGEVVFYENEWPNLPSQHNHPLYMTARARDVELKRDTLNQGSSLNIMSLSVLDAVGVPQET